jgi:integrase
MIEHIGPDIRDAWLEYEQLRAGTHPSQAAYAGLMPLDRVRLLLRRYQEEDRPLPGRIKDGAVELHRQHVMTLIGLHTRAISPSHARLIEASGLPIAPQSSVGTITGEVNGTPWRDRPLDVDELEPLMMHLYTAAFTVVCYLSGMRPGEVLNLRRGCRRIDPHTGELAVMGRRGKGRGRCQTPDDADGAERPWTVVEPVHLAIGLLESLADRPLLFPADALRANPTRGTDHHAMQSRTFNDALARYVAWVNKTFAPSADTTPIPPDPTKHLHASRFRRSLAYFIVRRPRGLVAAAIQYGHVSTKVTLGYAGDADTSWMEDLAVERLEFVLEQIDEDWDGVRDGEHVSGPSADEYRTRVTRVSRFAGRVVNQVRNVERLLNQADPGIHHGEGMTCVWRAETAACRRAKLEQDLPANDAPDEANCQSTCKNLAYTDRDIAHLRQRLVVLEVGEADTLSPRPLRDRAAAQAAQIRRILERHSGSPALGLSTGSTS